jgi:tRNA 2-thiouridine synthesizing protein C
MKFLYLFNRQAYGNSLAREALDMALATAAFDQDVSLVFCHDALYQLLITQNTANTESKAHIGVINALPLYDIENIYYLEEDRHDRNIDPQSIFKQAKPLARTELKNLLKTSECIQSF